MTINAQSGQGRIRIFEDFGVTVQPVLSTVAPPIPLGAYLQLVGQGLADTDSGAVRLDSDGLSGVTQFLTTNEDVHAAGVQTATMFDVALMGTIVMEARVRMAALTAATCEAFIGFSDVNTDLAIIEGAICHGDTVTLTLTASDICGFLLASDLTDADDWHAVFAGGTTTGVTASASNDLDDDAVAGEWQILRLEIDPNGTARWLIDGVLKKTVVGAVSTTTDLCFSALREAKTAAVATMDVDYILIEANRDWNA